MWRFKITCGGSGGLLCTHIVHLLIANLNHNFPHVLPRARSPQQSFYLGGVVKSKGKNDNIASGVNVSLPTVCIVT